MILNAIEKRRAYLLACDHPFIADAKQTNQEVAKQRDECVQVKSNFSSKLVLQSQNVFSEQKNS